MEGKQTYLQAELLQLSDSGVWKITTIPKIALVNPFHSFPAPLSTELGAAKSLQSMSDSLRPDAL